MKEFRFTKIHFRPEGMFGTGPDGKEYELRWLKKHGDGGHTTVRYKAKNGRWVTAIQGAAPFKEKPQTFTVHT